jgi:hypothetical protein
LQLVTFGYFWLFLVVFGCFLRVGFWGFCGWVDSWCEFVGGDWAGWGSFVFLLAK